MAHNIYSKTESRDGKPIKKQIIIAEKSTAAETIANNLSDGPVKSETKGPVTVWFIKFLGIDTVVIPLKGHIKDVKYSEEFKQWSEETLEKMIDAKLIYVDDAVDNIEIIEKYAKDADRVIIATDYDTEGESIGFEAIDVVRRVNKDVKIYRSVFSSLTKEELTEAFSNLKEPDKNLADSADARREVDLIIGAVLTRFISLAAHRLGNSFLSIGRVQTPTLTLIADREVERRAFKPKDYWIFTAKLKVRGSEFLASYKEEKIFDEKTVDKLRKLKNIKEARVVSVEKKERSVSPPKPFNTTDFLRSAAAVGFSVPNAMRIAQELYMKGYISYPRTDSQVFPPTLNLKEILKELGKEREYEKFVNEILSKPLHPTAGKEAKDHPPIHPVKVPPSGKLLQQEKKIFDLIARRFLATLSEPSKEETMSVGIQIGDEKFVSRGSKILFPGWRNVYIYSRFEENILPDIREGDKLDLIELSEEKGQTSPPPHYTQGGILKVMEELHLGTKSTRPEILKKLMDRKYISSSKTLTPSEMALAVIQNFKPISPELTGPELTAELEDKMENITNGSVTKKAVVDEARKDVREILLKLISKKDEISKSMREAISKQYVFGKCPVCGSDLKVVISKRTHKRFVGCSNYPKCTFSLPLPQSGRFFISPQTCPKCGLHMIEWKGENSKRTYIFCVNPACKVVKKDKSAAASKEPEK